jgi:hypothetical protein
VTTRSRVRSALRLALLYSPCLLALGVMIPRLLSPQFGLLDDGGMLRVSQNISAGDLPFHDLGDGRFRPVYWLWWWCVYAIAGLRPTGFFLASALILLLNTSALIVLTHRLGGTPRQAWLTGVLFALSSPAIENHYTLSKAEPLQLLLLLCILLVAARPGVGKRSLAVTVFGTGGLLLVAASVKETALLMAPLAGGWLALSWWRNRREPRSDSVQRHGALLLGIALGGVAYLALRQVFVGQALVGFGYAERYELFTSRVLSSASRWFAWLLHDFAYLLPLFFGGALLGRTELRAVRPRLSAVLLWLVGWMVFYLPWQFVADYYLLPFAAGAALLSASLVEAILSQQHRRGPLRIASTVMLALGVLLLPGALANAATMARLQLAIDSANSEAVQYLADAAPPGSRVQVNIQEPSEYLSEIASHLEVLQGRADMEVDVLSLDGEAPRASAGVVADPFIRNQVLLSSRIGIYERHQADANRRLEELLEGAVPSEIVQRRVRVLSVDPARLVCPLVALIVRDDLAQAASLNGSIARYCANAPLLDTRETVYGWRFFRPSRKG